MARKTVGGEGIEVKKKPGGGSGGGGGRGSSLF